MGYSGEALSAHVMYATGNSSHPVIGLRSPGSRIANRGDGVTAGVGFWGGLSARAGLIADYDEAFLKTASAYFDGLVSWYEAADIGATGEAVFAAVTDKLARDGMRSALNPGHLTGHDEWINTPIRPGSDQRIAFGHAVSSRHHSDPDAGRMGAQLRGRNRLRRRRSARRAQSPPSGCGRTDRSAPKLRSRRVRNRNQGFDPAPFIDPFMPSAFLARERTIADAGVTAVDNKGARRALA